MIEQLGMLGGRAIFEKAQDYRIFWPLVDDVTERKLLETYRSRRWTAFDPDEPAFAEAFAAHHGARCGIFTVNGTVNLQCALAACGIGRGGEVIGAGWRQLSRRVKSPRLIRAATRRDMCRAADAIHRGSNSGESCSRVEK
jgi:hypothetical protein